MKRVTPRTPQMSKAHEAIGKVLYNNCFPTLMGRFIYIQNDKCYFEILPNPEYTKYNECAGQIEYLPEYMVVCLKFEEE